MLIKAPKGTKDLLPSGSYRWHYIENIMRNICRKYDLTEIRTPIFEHTELFLRGVGDTTDVVQKEMYTFLDKGERSITLRPEGTAGVARAFIENGMASDAQPTKMYYLAAPIFRYENPQSGRLRQHHQFGIEVFGAKDASADAEVILLALDVITSVGIKQISLNINSIGCPNCRPSYNARLKEYFSGKDLCPTCMERLDKNPLRILDCKVDKCRQIAKDAPHIIDCLCEECSLHMHSLETYLTAAGVEYTINPFIVRGLDYYTKTVFEIISNEIGSQGTVCGGGRYDGLIKQVGGSQMCGVGFGMGMERLLMVMDSANVDIPPSEPLDLFIVTLGQAEREYAFKMLHELRGQGASCDFDHNARSAKAQFKYADKIGAKYVLTIGQNELETDTARLRNMHTGDETEIKLSNFTQEWRQIHG